MPMLPGDVAALHALALDIATEAPPVGSPVSAQGFPCDTVAGAVPALAVREGKVQRVLDDADHHSGSRLLELSPSCAAHDAKGVSGGPVVEVSSGKACGVVASVDGEGRPYAVRASEALSLLHSL